MKKLETVNSVGHVLCHDVTQIIKDEKKETAFRKGHIIREEDIPVLLSLSKDHLFIWEKQEGTLHEDEAAEILCGLCLGNGITRKGPKEGKIELFADMDGLFRVDVEKLDKINSLDEIVIAARHTYFPVRKGDKLAGVRVIPLVIAGEKLTEAKNISGETPIMEVLPYRPLKAGIVTTGNEVFYGRINDAFTPVVAEKMAAYGFTVCGHITVNDDQEKITAAIRTLLDDGAQMVVCTGGMSVDPDDMTPAAIRNSGAKIVSYGAPVLPGSMFLLSYTEDGVPVIGLPGCVMYFRITIFDLVLPRLAAGLKISKPELAKMGQGGLCLECDACVYPNCGFGKGV